MPVLLNAQDPEFETQFQALLSAKREDSPDVDHIVAGIIQDVRDRGDDAVLELTAKFDRLDLTADTMRFSEAEVEQYIATVSPEDRAALELAAFCFYFEKPVSNVLDYQVVFSTTYLLPEYSELSYFVVLQLLMRPVQVRQLHPAFSCSLFL